MQQWVAKLDEILSVGNRPLLADVRTVSRQAAIDKATEEFDIYLRQEMLQYESDFDRAVKELEQRTKRKGNRGTE
jgi:hypothetical protein